MIVHFLLFAIISVIAIFGLQSKQSNKKTILSLIIIFSVLLFFAGFRATSVGNDTKEYKRIFDIVSNEKSISDAIKSTRYEPGYIAYNFLVSRITDNFQYILIINSAIYIFASIWFIKKYSLSTPKTIMLYFTFGLYYLIMNIERQCIAISFFLFAIPFLENKRILPYILLILLASTFHSTSIILLILIFVPKVDFEKKTNILKWIVISLISVVLINYGINWIANISPYIGHYLTNSIYSKGNIRIASILMFVLRIIFISLIIILNKGKIIKTIQTNNRKQMILDKILVLDCIISLAAIGFNMYDRIEKFFCLGYIISIVNYIATMKSKTNRLVAYTLILLLSFSYLTISFIYRSEWSGIFPYAFYEKV